MLHADTILPALQGFTPRESLYVVIMEELQQASARAVADDLRLLIYILHRAGSITDGEEDLLWRAQEWLSGAKLLTRNRSTPS